VDGRDIQALTSYMFNQGQKLCNPCRTSGTGPRDQR
jgi:hypothetical protein